MTDTVNELTQWKHCNELKVNGVKRVDILILFRLS